MSKRYSRTFKFFDTEKQAQEFCNTENANAYIRKYHTANYTPWQSADGRENKFVAWYSVK